jgi:far upstream element-binding protein
MNAYNGSMSGIIVTVPDDKVGLIIGKGGATVKDMQARHGVKLQIPSTTEPGVTPLVRNISITGDEQGMAAAKYEVEMICQGLAVNRPQQPQQGLYAQPQQGMYGQPQQGMYGQQPQQGMYGQQQMDPYGMSNPYGMQGMQMQGMDPMYQMMMMQQVRFSGLRLSSFFFCFFLL